MVDMMDSVDNGHDSVINVKWIMVLLYAIIFLEEIFEPTRAMPVENL